MKNNKYFFKKIFLCLLIVLLCFLSSCNRENKNNEQEKKDIELTIISVNDFHGQLEEKDGKAGAARMARYITDTRAKNPEYTVVLSAGDMFQGTAISNVNYGADVINFMNMVDFDAMTIGNHEFDWGLNTVLAYRDGDQKNGEAEFPFLGNNIIEKATNENPDGIVDYTMIKRNDLDIAVVGFLGYDQKADIATSCVEDYDFLQPLDITREIIKEVRTKEGADIVIVCCHEDNDALNGLLSSGTGEYQVDAIINGHSHVKTTERLIRQEDNVIVPLVESGSSGEYVGVTTLKINSENKCLGGSAKNEMMLASKPKDEAVQTLIDNAIKTYAPVFQRVLCNAGINIYRSTGTSWAVKSLLAYANNNYGDFDLAAINDGGIRESAFPINKGEAVTVNHIYQMMPFDNTVKTTSLLGKDVQTLLKITGLSFAGITIIDNTYYINGKTIDPNQYYNVVSIDFIFDKTDYPFKNGINKVSTGILFRDVLINNLESLNGEDWLG